MTESFSPRTVITVALASLVAGFVTVFGGGMVALRGRAPRAETRPLPPLAPTPPVGSPPADTTAPELLPEASAAGSAAVGVTIAPATVSRCFAGMAPTAIPGARCDRLPALDQHLAARAAPVAACAQGARGRLTFIMDLRFSNQHVSAWGGPTSTIANAGVVSLCVRRATAPLPLAGIPHAHDRYIVSIPIEW